ncbi:ROK family protein [Subtercola boreus]|uniref:Transcriptional regulator n=1 Tax=Subtercola boreus TaxID=120213 RepID=A0A3E0WGC8_9MICO|nr:ROK family protein [Subtercola boreus]RFA22823.1 transcriptional regulator [Subtercola boreus]RFA23279.1 transcriptional regulator [Subtercola boreus]RFA29087.1 transcriptional regulator [Subtercola boreus]
MTDLPRTRRTLSAGVGNSNDQTRRHNLSTILTMLHHDGAQTRARLTRLAGLNRSTIGALVAELVDLDLAYETEPAESGLVGRPSPVVHPNERIAAITINPDVDAITVGVVGLGGVLHRSIRSPTDAVPTVQQSVDVASGLVRGLQAELDAGFRVVGVGIAVPGLVNSRDGVVTLAPHLGWRDADVVTPFAAALGRPVTVANDATLATVAESLFGAGRGVHDLVYLNGSASGIGGGVLAGGSMLRGAQGYSAELGHTLVNSAGIRCHCGKTGCLETEVNLGRLQAVLGHSGAGLDELDALIAAVPDARQEIDRQLDVLALAIGNFVSIFDPESIILGGFLGSLYEANPARLRASVDALSFTGQAQPVRLERAQLRSRLLTIGAAELVLAGLLDDPAGTAF